MKISLIIPAHNEEKYLGKTLDALAHQKKLLHEIIIVCDSCTDKTVRIARKSGARTFSIKARNIAKARNAGARKATGNAFIFLDADVIVSKEFVKNTIDALENGATFGGYPYRGETARGELLYGIFNILSRAMKMIGGICFVTKKLYDRAKGYDESLRLGEDTDFGERVKKQGGKYRYVPAPVIPSERKFREHGYILFTWGVAKESLIYIFNKKAHRRVYGT